MIEEEYLKDIDKKIEEINKIMVELFSFRKIHSIPNHIPQDLMIGIFLDNFESYLKFHLFEEMKSRMDKSAASDSSKLIEQIFKDLNTMISFFENVFNNLDKSKNSGLNLRQEMIKRIEKYLLDDLSVDQILLTYIFDLHSIYLFNLSSKIQQKNLKAQNILSVIESTKSLLKLEDRESENKIELTNLLKYINPFEKYKNLFIIQTYTHLEDLQKRFINNSFKNIFEGIAICYEVFQDFIIKGFYSYIYSIFSNLKFDKSLISNFEINLKINLEKFIKIQIERNMFFFIENSSLNLKFDSYVLNILENFEITDNCSLLFEESLNNKLIRLSVQTMNLLKFYINFLKFSTKFKENFKLQKYFSVIKSYLINRPDSLRCIIHCWIEELMNEELVDNSNKNKFNVPYHDDRFSLNETERDVEESGIFFQITTGKNFLNKIKYKKSDIKTLLVDMYGSKEKFLIEYENFLAEKILMFKEINFVEESSNFEVLKKYLKFSNNISRCDIIFSDIQKSENLNALFKSKNIGYENMELIILTKNLWPVNYEFQNPKSNTPFFEHFKEKFENFFKSINPQRKFLFHDNIGIVDMELNFNRGRIRVKCQPIQARIISFFEGEEIIPVSLRKIVEGLQLDPLYIKKKLQFWINSFILKNYKEIGVISQSMTNLNFQENSSNEIFFIINEDYNFSEEVIISKEDDNDQILNSKELNKIREEENQKIYLENEITNFLKSSGSQSFTKIFEILKTVYKNDIPKNFSESSCQTLLQKMVKKEKISFNADLYFVKTNK